MAAKIKCTVCGTEHEYCPHCAEFKNAPTWLAMYDTENCKDIWETLNKFAFGYLTKEEALETLKGKDLSKKADYPDDLKSVLAKLYDTQDKKERKPIKNND